MLPRFHVTVQNGTCKMYTNTFLFKLRFVVHGLETGQQYIFRVKAVNAVGFSENSQESEAITVQAALSKYESLQLSFLFLES